MSPRSELLSVNETDVFILLFDCQCDCCTSEDLSKLYVFVCRVFGIWTCKIRYCFTVQYCWYNLIMAQLMVGARVSEKTVPTKFMGNTAVWYPRAVSNQRYYAYHYLQMFIRCPVQHLKGFARNLKWVPLKICARNSTMVIKFCQVFTNTTNSWQ